MLQFEHISDPPENPRDRHVAVMLEPSHSSPASILPLPQSTQLAFLYSKNVVFPVPQALASYCVMFLDWVRLPLLHTLAFVHEPQLVFVRLNVQLQVMFL
jgi:hypothetical protein